MMLESTDLSHMKNFFLILTLLASVSHSQIEVADYSSADPMTTFETQYQWLYEKLIPANIRRQYPAETLKSFRVHLKDSYTVFPDPLYVKKSQINFQSPISGTMIYAGFFAKPYLYDVIRFENKLIFNVRIYFKDPNANDLNDFKIKLSEASSYWNNSKIKTDFDYEFKFELTTDPSKAHYHVNILDSSRGPYDTNWSRSWTSRVIAHEVGHMLGLGDEYQTLSSTIDCWKESLMCESWTGQLEPLHHYFVLRRLVK